VAGDDTRQDPKKKKHKNNCRQGDVLNVNHIHVLQLDEKQREETTVRANEARACKEYHAKKTTWDKAAAALNKIQANHLHTLYVDEMRAFLHMYGSLNDETLDIGAMRKNELLAYASNVNLEALTPNFGVGIAPAAYPAYLRELESKRCAQRSKVKPSAPQVPSAAPPLAASWAAAIQSRNVTSKCAVQSTVEYLTTGQESVFTAQKCTELRDIFKKVTKASITSIAVSIRKRNLQPECPTLSDAYKTCVRTLRSRLTKKLAGLECEEFFMCFTTGVWACSKVLQYLTTCCDVFGAKPVPGEDLGDVTKAAKKKRKTTIANADKTNKFLQAAPKVKGANAAKKTAVDGPVDAVDGPSASPRPTHFGPGLCVYEQEREKNIQRNQAMMDKLGIPRAQPPPKTTPKPVKQPQASPPTRKSSRIRANVEDSEQEEEEQEEEQEMEQEQEEEEQEQEQEEEQEEEQDSVDIDDDIDSSSDEDALPNPFTAKRQASVFSDAEASTPKRHAGSILPGNLSGDSLVGQQVYSYFNKYEEEKVHKATVMSANGNMCTLKWEHRDFTSTKPSDELFIVSPQITSSTSPRVVGELVSAQYDEGNRYLAYLISPVVTHRGMEGHLIRWTDIPDIDFFNTGVKKAQMWRRMSAKKMRCGPELDSDVVEHSDMHIEELQKWLKKCNLDALKAKPGEQGFTTQRVPLVGGGGGGSQTPPKQPRAPFPPAPMRSRPQ
jgi:hypothetical protein